MNSKNRMIVGRYEDTEYLSKKNLHSETSSRNTATGDAESDRSIRRNSSKPKFHILWKSFEAYKYIINSLKAQSKDASCPHPYSCAHYILAVRVIILVEIFYTEFSYRKILYFNK